MPKKPLLISDYSSIYFIIILLIGVILTILGFSNKNFREILSGNYAIIIGYFGLLIFAYDLAAKREMQKEEFKNRKKLHEEELDFRRNLYNDERSFKEERRKFERQQEESLKEISDNISEKVSDRLKKDTDWAVKALERAKLGIKGKSIFFDRLNHFREEKEHIAREFTPILFERCKNLIEQHGRKVFLVIDSGTTLYPFFEHIARLSVRLKQNGEKWLDNITIVTNNLSGLETLIENGRVNPNNRYSELAIKCQLLPGMPLPIYSAVIGKQTEKALENLRMTELKEKNIPIFIGLATGNWIRLRRSNPICPVPLARGDGHLPFKNILIDNSDEAFVISPLGKIFIEVGPEELNNALRLNEKNRDPDSQPYKEVEIEDDKAPSVKLISTMRYNHNILYRHSTRIADLISNDKLPLNNKEAFISNPINTVPHMLFTFDYKEQSTSMEKEKEFPHSSTRNSEFIKDFFRYPDK